MQFFLFVVWSYDFNNRDDGWSFFWEYEKNIKVKSNVLIVFLFFESKDL